MSDYADKIAGEALGLVLEKTPMTPFQMSAVLIALTQAARQGYELALGQVTR